MRESLPNFFRKYVLKNLSFKVVSLGIAVLLWWTVGRDTAIEIPMTVPLEFQHVPANLEMNSDYPFQVRVTVRGSEHLLQGMNPSAVHAVLDLEGAGPGERTFDLTAKQVQVPRNMKVVRIVPAQFHISFDRSASRSVAVQPRVIGTLLSGYGINEVEIDPPMVTVVGPEKRVKAITGAMTDPVDATGLVGTGTYTTHAYVQDPLLRVQTTGPIQVTVTTEKTSGRTGRP